MEKNMYKLKRNLTLCFVLASLLSCSKEGPSVPSENTGVMPQNIVYDEVLSSSSSISVIWDKDAAFNAGAVAFTVQLVKDPTADEAVFSHRIKTYEPRPCDTYCFCNLKQYERFYVRVRAEYATGVSDWTYLGSPTVIETGTGPIGGSINLYTAPQARLRAATSGSLAFEWSVTGYEYMELDLKRNYKVALFRDASCTDLLVSWMLRTSDNVFEGLEAGYWFEKDFPAFLFTGLETDRDYWFQVSDVTDGERVSETVKARTQVSKVAVSQTLSPATVGTYALYEDFEELIWGGGGFFRAAAYSSLMRYTANTFVKANGENPVNGPELFFPCGQNNEYELFSSMSAPVSHTRLKDWGQLETTGLIAGPFQHRNQERQYIALGIKIFNRAPIRGALPGPASCTLIKKAAVALPECDMASPEP